MYIGVDLGGTNIAAGLVNPDGEIVLKKSIPTPPGHDVEGIIKAMADISLSLVEEAGVDKSEVKWVGIGTPGTVDNENGVIIYANNLDFRNTPAAAMFQKYWDIPVYLGNDANCAALGEAYAGAAKDCQTAIMITLGTGLGGGIIIDKKIYAGFNGAGGELGHMTLVVDGVPCTCGRKGCWECYSSATALIRMTKEALDTDPNKESLLWKMVEQEGKVSGKTAYAAAAQGDALGQSVVDKFEHYLAMGIASIINIFQPEMLIIGGGVSKEGDRLLNSLNKRVFSEVYTRGVPQTQLKIATLGNDAGIVGAAMLGR